ncbi:MAG: alpha/beta hydrolase [Pirellulaceae bacterium]|nr:alpha/beta hydrolase [Pirellulaceae bacterium]
MLDTFRFTRRKCKYLIRFLVLASLCVFVIGLIVSWFVAGALIAPAPSAIGAPPSDLPVTEFVLESDSGSTIHGWHIRSDKGRGVIVLLHGIRSSRLGMLNRARMLHELGYSSVLIDLQAHGESDGRYIAIGHLEKHDVRSAVEYARREHPQESIGLIGVSLGGAAALLATPLNIDGMVLESVYTDIGDAIHNRVAARLGVLATVPTAVLKMQLSPRLGISPSQLRPIDHIADVDCPMFIASGTQDLHTTESDTQTLFSHASEPKELWLVEGAAHVDLFQYSSLEYTKRIGSFFEGTLQE